MTGRNRVHEVFVGIGSNIERKRNITDCLSALVEAFRQVAVSSLYESRSFGYDGPPYYNLVAHFATDLSLPDLNRLLHHIEDEQGRMREAERFADRTLDIDILLYDDIEGAREGVNLPREEIFSAAHVLLPLSEIAGDRRVPGDGRTIRELWLNSNLGEQSIERVEFCWHGTRLPAMLRPERGRSGE